MKLAAIIPEVSPAPGRGTSRPRAEPARTSTSAARPAGSVRTARANHLHTAFSPFLRTRARRCSPTPVAPRAAAPAPNTAGPNPACARAPCQSDAVARLPNAARRPARHHWTLAVASRRKEYTGSSPVEIGRHQPISRSRLMPRPVEAPLTDTPHPGSAGSSTGCASMSLRGCVRGAGQESRGVAGVGSLMRGRVSPFALVTRRSLHEPDRPRCPETEPSTKP